MLYTLPSITLNPYVPYHIIAIVKLQSSLTVQSKSVGLGVGFVFPPSHQQLTPTKIYQKKMYYRLEIWQLDLTHKIKTR